MAFYYAAEKKRFEQEWAQLRKEYAAAGMDEDAIQRMYEFDLEVFRSQRTYSNHTQPLPNEYIDEDGLDRSVLFRKYVNSTISFDETDFPGRYAWVETIENQKLARLLRQLTDKDLEVLTFLVMEEHSQRELAKKWSCSQKVVSSRLNRIKKFFKKFEK